MMQAFYLSKPGESIQYRHSYLRDSNGWQIQLIGNAQWKANAATVLKDVAVNSFDEGKAIYDAICSEMECDGWKPYSVDQPYLYTSSN